MKKVAAITSGFVGADLANLVNEAALLAARNSKSSVTMDEFNEAVERVTAGLEKRQRLIQEDEKQRVAYHESAHALVAYCLPNTDPVHKVSIIPRGLAALGYTMHRPEGDRYLMTQSELESRSRCSSRERWPRRSCSTTFRRAPKTTWNERPTLRAAWSWSLDESAWPGCLPRELGQYIPGRGGPSYPVIATTANARLVRSTKKSAESSTNPSITFGIS